MFIHCRGGVNMDKRPAKRKTPVTQDRLIQEANRIIGGKILESDIREVARCMSNTGKFSMPIYYIRLDGMSRVSTIRLSLTLTRKFNM